MPINRVLGSYYLRIGMRANINELLVECRYPVKHMIPEADLIIIEALCGTSKFERTSYRKESYIFAYLWVVGRVGVPTVHRRRGNNSAPCVRNQTTRRHRGFTWGNQDSRLCSSMRRNIALPWVGCPTKVTT